MVMSRPVKGAHVFPGQGAQAVGMGRDLYDSFAAAKAVFKQADEVLGFSLSKMCFEGPEEELRLTINTQPAIVTVSYACLKAAQEVSDGRLMEPAFVAGHSLGEYTALAAASVLDLGSTVRLTRERGRLMHEAGLRQPGGMAAVIGLDEDVLAEVCQETGTQIANFNCPGQLVISGAEDKVAKAMDLAKEKGATRVVPLVVSGAFHSPLMQPAVDGLSEVIGTLDFQDPSFPIIANTTAKPLTNAAEVRTELINQMSNSVQWQRSVEYMIDNGVSNFIEIGPGRVLTGLIKRINKDVDTVNISDAETVKSLGQ